MSLLTATNYLDFERSQEEIYVKLLLHTHNVQNLLNKKVMMKFRWNLHVESSEITIAQEFSDFLNYMPNIANLIRNGRLLKSSSFWSKKLQDFNIRGNYMTVN